jgi:DNA-binding NtrC family response regulator
MGQMDSLNLAILIVEDEVLVRLELADIVEEAGYAVYEAGNAEEAIKLMEMHREIRILMTDVDMPGSMDGLKLSHYVKHRWPPVRIVVASGHVSVKQHELPQDGVFLDKPYDTPKVLALLSDISRQLQAL